MEVTITRYDDDRWRESTMNSSGGADVEKIYISFDEDYLKRIIKEAITEVKEDG